MVIIRLSKDYLKYEILVFSISSIYIYCIYIINFDIIRLLMNS